MSTGTDKDKKNRYPGLRPFVKEESAVFFGRNVEIEQLIDSIKVNKSFILFGKSGLGKSSLISAGVLPKLVKQHIAPVIIRFYNANTAQGSKETKQDDPLLNITTELKKQLDKTVLALFPETDDTRDLSLLLSLWTQPETPLIIFDQFEEFFYFDKDKREVAIAQIAAIANHDVFSHPDLRRPATQEIPEIFHERKIPLKLLFLIRSDKLNLMDEVFEKIPGIFNNRFNLKPLLKEKAEQSIILPAQIRDAVSKEGYKTPSYFYERSAVAVILDTLSSKSGEIESSQLQIVCQELEQIAEHKSRSHGSEITITEEDFNGQAGIKEILNRFYWKQLDKLRTDDELQFSEKEIRGIRYLIENELVSDNKRIIQSANRVREIIKAINPILTGSNQQTDTIIDKLLDLRLIREEDSHLGKVYEISHDTLLESIIKSKDERMKSEQEEKIKEQNELLEQERRNSEKERKLKEKARQEREKAIEAEQSALAAKKEAEAAWNMALDEEKKAKRDRIRLRWALAAFVLVVAFAAFILIRDIIISKKERQNYKYLSGKIFLFNALTAYNDGNYALAFNLAREADQLFDRKEALLDSLVAVWPLEEYSGETEISENGAYIACRYENRDLQIFALKDSVRKNNPRAIIRDVDYFKLSPDGSKLVTLDIGDKRYRFYRIEQAGNKLDTVRLWDTKLDTQVDTFMNNNWVSNSWAAVLRKGDTLELHLANAARSGKLNDPKLRGIQNAQLMADGDLIYIASSGNHPYSKRYRAIEQKFIKVDFKTGKVEEENTVRVLNYSMNGIYIIDPTKRIIEKIHNKSRDKIIDLRHTVFEPFDIIESKNWYILEGYDEKGNADYCIQKPGLQGQMVEIAREKPQDMGTYVQHSENQPMYVHQDTLTIRKGGGRVRKYALPLGGAERSWYGFTLSADGSFIYFEDAFMEKLGYIALSDSLRGLKAVYLPNRDLYLSLEKRNLLFSSWRCIDTVKHSTSYWRGFYEPLSKQDTINYGIKQIK